MLKNMTPHEIVVNGVSIAPFGHMWRVNTTTKNLAVINYGDVKSPDIIPVVTEEVGEINFAGYEPTEGEHYIVSRPLAAALVAKNVPGTFYVPGELVRNEVGQPIGCKNLVLVTN